MSLVRGCDLYDDLVCKYSITDTPVCASGVARIAAVYSPIPYPPLCTDSPGIPIGTKMQIFRNGVLIYEFVSTVRYNRQMAVMWDNPTDSNYTFTVISPSGTLLESTTLLVIGCLLGDKVVANGCNAHISCNGTQDVECTRFPSNVTQYTAYVLKAYDTTCSTPISPETAYLESYNGLTWTTLDSYTSTSTYYGYSWVSYIVITNNWIGQMRIRWGQNIKTWSQEVMVQCSPVTATLYLS